MVIRIPSVRQDPGSVPLFTAPNVEPVRDVRGAQIAQAGEAVVRAGSAVTYVGQVYDKAQVAERDAMLSEVFREEMHAPEKGYLTTVGADAGEARRKKTFDTIEEKYQRLSASLGNSVQRDALQGQYQQRLEKAMQAADAHEGQQAIVYAAGAATARLESAKADAVLGFGTIDFDANRTLMMMQADEVARLRGWPEGSPQRTAWKRETISDLHTRVVDGMLANDQGSRAREYLAGVPDAELLPEAKAKLQKGIEHTELQQRSFEAAQWAASKSPRLIEQVAALDTLTAAKHLDVAVRDRAVERLQFQNHLVAEQEHQAVNQAFATAQKALAARPDLDPQDLDPKLVQFLSDSGKLDALIAFANNGRHVNRSAALRRLPELQDSGELARMSAAGFEREFRGNLDNQTFERWDAKRASMRNEATQKQGYIRTLTADLEELLIEAKVVDRNEKNGAKIDRQQRFITALQNEFLQNNITDRGKQLELAKQRLTATVMVDDWGSDSAVPDVSLTRDEAKTAYIVTEDGRTRTVAGLQALPASELAAIDRDLRAQGVEPTDPTRLRYYANVVEPWQQARQALSLLPPELQLAGQQAVREAGGNPADPVQVHKAAIRVRSERVKTDLKAIFEGRDPPGNPRGQ